MTLSKEVYTSHFSSRYEPPLRAAHYFEIISWNSQLFLPDFSIWLLSVRILLGNNLLSVNSEKTLWMQCKPCFSASIMTLQERILVWKGGQNYWLVHYYIGNAPLIFITFSNITNKTIFYQSHLFLLYTFVYVLLLPFLIQNLSFNDFLIILLHDLLLLSLWKVITVLFQIKAS